VAAALAFLLAAGFLLFETTTSSTSSGVSRGACGRGAGVTRWPDASLPPPQASYERGFRDGEVLEVTFPAGPFEYVIETEGGLLEAMRMPLPTTPSTGQCSPEPYTVAYLARGEGVARVHFWVPA
jgi:hypothetical protein